MEGTGGGAGYLCGSGWQTGGSNHTYWRGDSTFLSVSSREPARGQAVSAEGAAAIWRSRAKKHFSCSSGCPKSSSPGQPSVVQQIWYLFMPHSFALFKAQAVCRLLRWRVEPGYIRRVDVVKETPASIGGALRRTSLRPLHCLTEGTTAQYTFVHRCRILFNTHWSYYRD